MFLTWQAHALRAGTLPIACSLRANAKLASRWLGDSGGKSSAAFYRRTRGWLLVDHDGCVLIKATFPALSLNNAGRDVTMNRTIDRSWMPAIDPDENHLLNPTPTDITASKEAGRLQMQWSDGRSDAIPFWDLRCACPCAVCISELTGQRLLDPSKIDAAVHPVQIELAGNYAIKIAWSDGHHTGLFTWSLLRELGDVGRT